MGVYGVCLDIGFIGVEEVKMMCNFFGIKIEINMSLGMNYVDNIMSYLLNMDNLLGFYNFYFYWYFGLGYDYFVFCLEKFRKYNLNMMVFVNL